VHDPELPRYPESHDPANFAADRQGAPLTAVRLDSLTQAQRSLVLALFAAAMGAGEELALRASSGGE
jgi:hypothetical protein